MLELIVGWKRRCKWQMMVAVVVHMTGGVTCSMLSLVHAEQLLFSCVILTFCGKTVENLFRYSVSQVIGVHCIVQLGSFLTECVSSKVTVTVMLSHVTFHCHMSNAYVDTWDMLNNFCFHVIVYAQKSLFISENGNVFWTATTPKPLT